MTSPLPRLLAAVFALAVAVGCASRGPRSIYDLSPVERARVDSMRMPYVQADIDFMQGMIPHHAQAIVMSRWASTNGARRDVQDLAERIIVSQRDEIELMRTWLRDRNQRVPPPDATRHRMTMGGMEHDMLMPGMLTDEELRQLETARGSDFDRLFLTFMIRHHEGAISMVNTLFGTPRAGQDEIVFQFASDVFAEQGIEIERMQMMLETVPPAGGRGS